ncbi:MAG: type II toxin-antitoxin system RelE/ParE family toxin [Candidatus Adiutrix sp.]|jgi:phage-related protein|nr:type II toxin-antitoxin system RelE/ParE family toxin [Candidatus Adiutrix sp.]
MKSLYWVGSSKKDLREMSDEIKDAFGFAIFLAQQGQKHDKAKALKGFGSAGVLELVESNQGGTYRTVYTVRFKDAVYVLHCFQKKSKSGIATPKSEIDLIKTRLKQAEAHAREVSHE